MTKQITPADPKLVAKVKDLSKKYPLVDSHNDFPYLIRKQLHYEFTSCPQFDFNHTTAHTDLTRLKEGGVGIQMFSCYIEYSDDVTSPDFNKPTSVVRDTMEQIDCVKRLCQEYDLKVVRNSTEALEAFNKGYLAVTIGIEGLHQVDISLSVIRLYYELGVRYITLTHNGDNVFATSAAAVHAGSPDKGLTKFGVECVAEMNRLGMIVDLSHVSNKTMKDVFEVTKSPIIFSHSSCYGLTDHFRNVPDEILPLIKANSGVMCVNFFSLFLSQDGTGHATIDDAADHIAYIIKKIGWDYVGLGSDFDGCNIVPTGLEDVSRYPELVAKVLERVEGTDEDIIKLLGGNIMRVWKANELVAEKLKEIKPNESNWDGRDWYYMDFGMPELFPGSQNLKKSIVRSYTLTPLE